MEKDNIPQNTYENFKDFMKATENRMFRFWVFKKFYTPYELEHKFLDESVYEDTTARLGFICEMIILPDRDILLGIAEIVESVSDLNDEYRSLSYYKLSEIRISYYPKDADEYA